MFLVLERMGFPVKCINMVSVFIWGAKMERVRREIMYRDECNGGRGMPDVKLLLSVRYLGMIVRLSGMDNLVGDMVRYSGGKVLKKYKWLSGS